MKLLMNTRINHHEIELAKASGLDVKTSRLDCKNDTIICRYGVLPHYQELEKDLNLINSKLINSYEQHLYIANFLYYNDIKKYTPKTWFNYVDIDENVPMVVKGITNSKKMNWDKYMFANNKKEALDKMFLLQEDTYLNNQDIIFRKFEKLKTYEFGINNIPITNEWRFFFLHDQLIDYGYYWSISEQTGVIDNQAILFAKKIGHIISKKVNFYVVDIAQKENGDWIVIEINDGQMSGLSTIPPERFYKNLKKIIS